MAVVLFLLLYQVPAESLPDDHHRWLEDEVRYIIAEEERELFLSLDTDEDRERFIEAFWDRRDPDRLTPINEYREEHYRRLGLADRRFGASATRPGSRTERGQYFVLLGEPSRIEPYVGSNEIVDCEIWFYYGADIPGLPPRFNLVFFRQNNTGDYRIYSPLDDGPEALLNQGAAYLADRSAGMNVLAAASMDLARASLTVDLSDPVADFLAPQRLIPNAANEPAPSLNVRPSGSANLALADILDSPRRAVDTDYVEGYRRYGDRVSADFSFKYVSNRDYWTVLYEPDGAPFVHYGIEIDPQHVTFRPGESDGKLVTQFAVEIEVRARGRGPLDVPGRRAYVEISSEELDVVRSVPLAYQDSFPLIPGAYQISVTLRNLVGGHFTVLERNLSVAPLDDDGPTLGGVGLGYAVSTPDESGSFATRGTRVLPAGDALFPKDATVHTVTQVARADANSVLHVTLQNARGPVQRHEVRPVTSTAVQRLVLADLESGSYTVVFELVHGGEVVATKSTAFDVVEQEVVPRPALIYRNVVQSPSPEETARTLAEQYLAQGQIAGAERELRKVPLEDAPQVRWQLASLVLFSARADEALELLQPIEDDYPDQVEVVEGLGFAYYLRKEYAEALPRLERAMVLRAPDTSVLNAVGDCYQQLGRPDKAREMFELSLSVNPEQPGVLARLAELDAM